MQRLMRTATLAAGAVMLLPRASGADGPGEAKVGLPLDVSTEGHRIDALLHQTLVLVGLLFLGMLAWMAYALFRHRQGHSARFERGEGAAGKALPLGMAAFVFLVVDGNLFVKSSRDIDHVFWNFSAVESRPDALRIEVNARQWAWDFRYPGPDGRFDSPDDVITLNELKVPAGRPVVLQIGSTDVIHSFNLPNLRVKVDALPGSISRAWFQATRNGQFELACAQHCGTHHYKMRGLVTVLPEAEFQSWLAEAQAHSLRAFDELDESARWGWSWKDHRP
ncbi:MAG: cytochrome C oxidase subunit II [Myxococcales bacterium]|nr:cytochrome C oxidase subunit II [Myxococcales bacterium]